VRHAALAVARGVAPRDLLAARRATRQAGTVPVVSHGDYHAGNLMWDGTSLWVIDWELLAPRPAGWDLMTLWPTLEDGGDRQRLFDAAVRVLGEESRPALARLRYAAAVRVASDKLAPRNPVNSDPEGGRALVAELAWLRAEARA
jgi:aminoglycoside phosphotransferase (APT) family kinase protein